MTRYVDLYPVNVEISINSILCNGNNALVRIRGRCNPDNSEYNNSFLRPRAASLATNRVNVIPAAGNFSISRFVSRGIS